jgi:multifunctional beta-oxidation protein
LLTRAAAKNASLGFIQTIAREGAKYNILANALATNADLASILQEEALGIDCEAVPRSVASLVHADNISETGHLYLLEGSHLQKVRWQRALGAFMNPDLGMRPGSILSEWSAVNDFSKATYPDKSNDFEAVLLVTRKIGQPPQGPSIRFDGKVVLITGAGGG